MPIIGIDYDKCANCGICSTICPRNFREDKKQGKIVFEDPKEDAPSAGTALQRALKTLFSIRIWVKVLASKELTNPKHSYHMTHCSTCSEHTALYVTIRRKRFQQIFCGKSAMPCSTPQRDVT